MTRKEIFETAAISMLGVPYLYGQKNRLVGLDCSGFVCESLRSVGLLCLSDELNAQQLYDRFYPRRFSGTTGTGFLVFLGRDASHIDHVGILLDPQDNLFIEAGGGDPTMLTLDQARIKGACVRIRQFAHAIAIVAV